MNIYALEQYLFTGNHREFKAELFKLLGKLEQGSKLTASERDENNGATAKIPGIYPFSSDRTFYENQNAAHQLAALVTAFLSHRELSLNAQEINQLIFHKHILSDLFYLSDYGTLDHILIYRGLWSPEDGFSIAKDSDVFLLLIVWTINSRFILPFQVLRERLPGPLMLTLTSALYQLEQLQTPQAFEAMPLVIDEFCHLPDEIELNLSNIMLVNIWMGCSYWDIDSRHRVKQKINKLFRHAYPTIAEVKKRNFPGNPRVAILLEKYRSDHAVYRCYHAHLLDLKKSFHTCLFAEARDLDDLSRRDGDQSVTFDTKTESIESIAKKITAFKPDVVLYPSLGMSVWSVILSNFRLAPIQIMSYGHPASAFSDVIDYGLLVGLKPGPGYQTMCQEKVISFDLDYGQDIELHPQTDFSLRSPRTAGDNEPVRIAVNSSLMKISDRVLQACRLIKDNSSTPVEFHFFPSHERAFKLLALEKKITNALGFGNVIHPPRAYQIYQNALASCHFAIGTFPFGGTNTNIDSILLGQPKLYLKGGDELAEKTDYSTFLRFDEEGGYAYDSELELVAAAIIWIHDPKAHATAVESVLRMREQLVERLSTAATTPEPTEHYFTRGIKRILGGAS